MIVLNPFFYLVKLNLTELVHNMATDELVVESQLVFPDVSRRNVRRKVEELGGSIHPFLRWFYVSVGAAITTGIVIDYVIRYLR